MPFPRFALVVALLSLSGLPVCAARARPPAYKGAIAMDAATGRVLFADNADEVSPPASMTKLMTYAVLTDRIGDGALSLQSPILVTPEDAKVFARMRDSTNVALKAKESFTVEELIYAIMIKSANDAAYTLGRAAGGTVENFVGLMNAKARAIGMTHTLFRTPNGFPVPSHRIADGDLTTPRDFALLCRYLVLHTDVLKYTSVKTRSFGAGERAQPILMSNYNRLLGKVAGVDGLKSGFTNGAGMCLSATAQRNGRRVIAVVMGSPDWTSLDLEVAELINRGFTQLPIFPADPPAAPSAASSAAPSAAKSAVSSDLSSPSRPAPASLPPAAPMPTIQFNPPR